MKNEPYKQTVHNVILEGRERVSISGVVDVESFDEQEIVMETCKGNLIITGEGLKVEKLSIETGDTIIEGNITGMEYSDKGSSKGSFWSKIF